MELAAASRARGARLARGEARPILARDAAAWSVRSCVLAGATAACASGGATPSAGRRAHARPGAPRAAVPPLRPAKRSATASPPRPSTLRGVPYRNGGTTPTASTAAGFVRYVFAQHGRPVPRLARDQFDAGKRVSRDDVRAGDLVFFSTVAPGASHVGIALDDDEFVHAPNSRGVVRVERLTTDYWRRRFVGARRVPD